MDEFKPQTKTINLMLLDGGLGDHVGSLVAVNYIATKHPWITPLVWVPDYLVNFAKHVLPQGLSVRGFSQMRGQYEPKRPTKSTKWDGTTSPMKIHSVDYAFLKLCDELPETKYRNYLQIRPNEINIDNFQLKNPYVCVTTGFTASVREWPAAEVNKTVAAIKAKGLEVVFLGQTQTNTGVLYTIKGNFNDDIDFTAGINLVDKTNLLEAAAIMAGAQAVLGVDNGLLHLAGCTDVNIIGGFTTVSPEIRMPYRKGMKGYKYYPVIPNTSLGCRFCQQTTNFLYGHKYTDCFNKHKLCTTQMTAEKFIYNLKFIGVL